MRRVGWFLIETMVVVALVGCGLRVGPSSGVGGGAARGGSSANAASGSGGGGGALVGTGMGGAAGGDGLECGLHTYTAVNLPTDVLIVQDRSASMANDLDDQGGCQGASCKWPSVTAALDRLVLNTETTTNWGITFFPSADEVGGSCTVNDGAVLAPVAMNAAAIARATAATAPSGGTPTRAAIKAAAGYLNSLGGAGPKYILLATDGQPTCLNGNDGTDDAGAIDPGAVDAIAAVYADGAGIPVLVVGIGNVAASEGTLNDMATAGGRAQVTPDVDPATGVGRVYYPADDQAQLDATVALVSAQVVSCAFQLGGIPPDPLNIAVLGDNKLIAKDPADGWSYATGMTSIVLNGASCQQLKSGAIHEVETIFGCGGLIIIP